jgi:streptogramin lyase
MRDAGGPSQEALVSVRSIPRHTHWLLALILLATALGVPAPAAAITNLPVAGGTTVAITGSGFTPGAKVFFGGAEATAVVVVHANEIVCRTLAHAAGAVTLTVTVTDPIPKVGSLTNGFVYTSVAADPAPVTQEFATPTPASLPEGIAAGPDGNLWFAEYHGSSIGMLVVAPPAIAALSPLSGPANATRNVTITGSGFAPGATVSFGGLSAPLTFVNNPTSINTFAPAHSPGTVDVVVTSGGATATVHGFTYGAPDLAPPPRLPGAAGNYPDPLPPSRGGPTGGMPDALPVPRPLFP